MKIEAYICDKCKKKRKCFHFKENIGEEMDPSGNGYNTNWKYYDICKFCKPSFLIKHPIVISVAINRTII